LGHHALAGASAVLADAPTGGGYISIWKSILLIGLLLAWCWGLAWADKDAKAAHMPRVMLNSINTGGMVFAYLLIFFVPLGAGTFYILFLVALIILAAEVFVYLKMRDKAVGLTDLKEQYENWRKGLRKARPEDMPGPIALTGKNGAVPVPTGEMPERPAYEAVQVALTDPLRKGADQIDLSPVPDGVGIKYLVDLVSYQAPMPLDTLLGPAAITYLKQIAGVDPNEKRKPQTGSIKLEIDGKKREAKVQTAGTTAGEFVRLLLDPKARHARKLAELGFTPGQMDVVKEQLKAPGGVCLLATPKGQGLTQLYFGMMRGHDAFMQHIQAVEHDPQDDIEGVTVTKMPPTATPDEVAKKIDWALSQQPVIMYVDKLESPQGAAALIRFSQEGHRAYVGMRAGSIAEAIEQWRRVAGTDPVAVDQLRMVIVGRVIRRLCQACKEPYTPDQNTLKKLNMDPAKVTQLFKARETPVRDQKGNVIPCTFCGDMRFKGRTGVFELVVLTDELKQAVKQDLAAAGGRLGSTFRTAFRKAKGRYLQEEALAMVERGETSVQEVLRVLKP
ncbi:MAG TPA: ATPase, T2SS/T4P/T4SS family, partial [Humisphaera sp.]